MGMQTSVPIQVPADDIVSLKKTTHFTQGEINYLYTRFRELIEQKGRRKLLLRGDVAFVAPPLDDLILDQMFGVNYSINFVGFAKFLHIFKRLPPTASQAEHKALRLKKLHLLFAMYDVDNNGNIDKHDLMDIVHRLYSDFLTMQEMTLIVHTAMKEVLSSVNDKIMFNHFCKALEFADLDLLAIDFPTL